MSYIPPKSHIIPAQEAYNMIERYQKKKDEILKPEVKAINPDILTTSETFNKEAILEYFSRPDIKYIRIYQGMSVNGEFHSILVGADEKGVDIFPTGYGKGDGHGHGGGHGHPPGDDPDPIVFEDGVRCPTSCPPPGGPLTDLCRRP